MQSLDTRFLLLVTLIPTGLAVLTSFALMIVYQRRATETRDWPQTMGRITSVNVEARQQPAGRGTYTMYIPRVIYEYEILARRYQGSQIRRGDPSGYRQQRAAEKALEGFIAGSLVTVYYQPENPAEAVISQEAGGRVRVFSLVAICSLVAMVLDVTIIGVILPAILRLTGAQ